MIDELRTRTKQAHQQLDHTVFPFIQAIRDKEQYARLLSVFYGFFAPLQRRFDQFLTNELIPDYAVRRKPDSILNDLKAINAEWSGTFCEDLPDIKDSTDAMGVFYVLEGSSMGGSIISKKISSHLGLTENRAVEFFSAYREQNPAMWNEFLNSLRQYEEKNACAEKIIKAAEDCFVKFKTWINLNYATN